MARNREFNTEKVIGKAIDLFWEKGYNGVSTQELADEFGISKSSMYGAFGDKMQLFTTALEKYRFEVYSDTINRLENCSKVKKEIRSIFTGISAGAMADKKNKGCFVVNSAVELAPHDKKIAAIVLQHRQGLEKAFANAIRKGIKNGEIPAGKKPAILGKVFCNAISGIQVDAKYLKDAAYFEEVINALMDMLN